MKKALSDFVIDDNLSPDQYNELKKYIQDLK